MKAGAYAAGIDPSPIATVSAYTPPVMGCIGTGSRWFATCTVCGPGATIIGAGIGAWAIGAGKMKFKGSTIASFTGTPWIP